MALSLALCFILSPLRALPASTVPAEAVSSFFQALAAGDCETAARLCPGLDKSQCGQARRVEVLEQRLEFLNPEVAIVLLDVRYSIFSRDAGRETESRFLGFVTLATSPRGWVILDDSYRAKATYSLDRYLKEVAAVLMPPGNLSDPASLEEEPGNAPPAFGSQAILEALWTPEQLEGGDWEKKILYRDKRDTDPPARTEPHTPLPPLPPGLRGSIRSVAPPGGEKLVALTFDVCQRSREVTGYDAALVNYLRANKVPATFFAGGAWMASHPQRAMQLMVDPLFEVGSHAWTHGNFAVLDSQAAREQILWTQAQYELLWEALRDEPLVRQIGILEMEKIPRVPATFRFPYGRCNAQALEMLANYGLPAIQWDVVTADPVKNQTARRIANAVLNEVKPGSIIIAHANGRGVHTAESLPLFIPELRRRGYRFVTVSQLLAAGDAISSEECYELSPGDNAHYDRLFGDGT